MEKVMTEKTALRAGIRRKSAGLLTLLLVAVLLLAVGMLAGGTPARKATAADPAFYTVEVDADYRGNPASSWAYDDVTTPRFGLLTLAWPSVGAPDILPQADLNYYWSYVPYARIDTAPGNDAANVAQFPQAGLNEFGETAIGWTLLSAPVFELKNADNLDGYIRFMVINDAKTFWAVSGGVTAEEREKSDPAAAAADGRSGSADFYEAHTFAKPLVLAITRNFDFGTADDVEIIASATNPVGRFAVEYRMPGGSFVRVAAFSRGVWARLDSDLPAIAVNGVHATLPAVGTDIWEFRVQRQNIDTGADFGSAVGSTVSLSRDTATPAVVASVTSETGTLGGNGNFAVTNWYTGITFTVTNTAAPQPSGEAFYVRLNGYTADVKTSGTGVLTGVERRRLDTKNLGGIAHGLTDADGVDYPAPDAEGWILVATGDAAHRATFTLKQTFLGTVYFKAVSGNGISSALDTNPKLPVPNDTVDNPNYGLPTSALASQFVRIDNTVAAAFVQHGADVLGVYGDEAATTALNAWRSTNFQIDVVMFTGASALNRLGQAVDREAIARVAYTTPGNVPTSYTGTVPAAYPIVGNSVGTYHHEFAITNGAGAVAPLTLPVDWIDTQTPTFTVTQEGVAVVSPAAVTWTAAPVAFSLLAANPTQVSGVKFEYRVDGSADGWLPMPVSGVITTGVPGWTAAQTYGYTKTPGAVAAPRVQLAGNTSLDIQFRAVTRAGGHYELPASEWYRVRIDTYPPTAEASPLTDTTWTTHDFTTVLTAEFGTADGYLAVYTGTQWLTAENEAVTGSDGVFGAASVAGAKTFTRTGVAVNPTTGIVTKTYAFAADANGTYQFKAIGHAGIDSGAVNVAALHIDKVQPTFTVSAGTYTDNGTVWTAQNVTYTLTPTAVNPSAVTYQYRTYTSGLGWNEGWVAMPGTLILTVESAGDYQFRAYSRAAADGWGTDGSSAESAVFAYTTGEAAHKVRIDKAPIVFEVVGYAAAQDTLNTPAAAYDDWRWANAQASVTYRFGASGGTVSYRFNGGTPVTVVTVPAGTAMPAPIEYAFTFPLVGTGALGNGTYSFFAVNGAAVDTSASAYTDATGAAVPAGTVNRVIDRFDPSAPSFTSAVTAGAAAYGTALRVWSSTAVTITMTQVTGNGVLAGDTVSYFWTTDVPATEPRTWTPTSAAGAHTVSGGTGIYYFKAVTLAGKEYLLPEPWKIYIDTVPAAGITLTAAAYHDKTLAASEASWPVWTEGTWTRSDIQIRFSGTTGISQGRLAYLENGSRLYTNEGANESGGLTVTWTPVYATPGDTSTAIVGYTYEGTVAVNRNKVQAVLRFEPANGLAVREYALSVNTLDKAIPAFVTADPRPQGTVWSAGTVAFVFNAANAVIKGTDAFTGDTITYTVVTLADGAAWSDALIAAGTGFANNSTYDGGAVTYTVSASGRYVFVATTAAGAAFASSVFEVLIDNAAAALEVFAVYNDTPAWSDNWAADAGDPAAWVNPWGSASGTTWIPGPWTYSDVYVTYAVTAGLSKGTLVPYVNGKAQPAVDPANADWLPVYAIPGDSATPVVAYTYASARRFSANAELILHFTPANGTAALEMTVPVTRIDKATPAFDVAASAPTGAAVWHGAPVSFDLTPNNTVIKDSDHHIAYEYDAGGGWTPIPGAVFAAGESVTGFLAAEFALVGYFSGTIRFRATTDAGIVFNSAVYYVNIDRIPVTANVTDVRDLDGVTVLGATDFVSHDAYVYLRFTAGQGAVAIAATYGGNQIAVGTGAGNLVLVSAQDNLDDTFTYTYRYRAAADGLFVYTITPANGFPAQSGVQLVANIDLSVPDFIAAVRGGTPSVDDAVWDTVFSYDDVVFEVIPQYVSYATISYYVIWDYAAGQTTADWATFNGNAGPAPIALGNVTAGGVLYHNAYTVTQALADTHRFYTFAASMGTGPDAKYYIYPHIFSVQIDPNELSDVEITATKPSAAAMPQGWTSTPSVVNATVYVTKSDAVLYFYLNGVLQANYPKTVVSVPVGPAYATYVKGYTYAYTAATTATVRVEAYPNNAHPVVKAGEVTVNWVDQTVPSFTVGVTPASALSGWTGQPITFYFTPTATPLAGNAVTYFYKVGAAGAWTPVTGTTLTADGTTLPNGDYYFRAQTRAYDELAAEYIGYAAVTNGSSAHPVRIDALPVAFGTPVPSTTDWTKNPVTVTVAVYTGEAGLTPVAGSFYTVKTGLGAIIVPLSDATAAATALTGTGAPEDVAKYAAGYRYKWSVEFSAEKSDTYTVSATSGVTGAVASVLPVVVGKIDPSLPYFSVTANPGVLGGWSYAPVTLTFTPRVTGYTVQPGNTVAYAFSLDAVSWYAFGDALPGDLAATHTWTSAGTLVISSTGYAPVAYRFRAVTLAGQTVTQDATVAIDTVGVTLSALTATPDTWTSGKVTVTASLTFGPAGAAVEIYLGTGTAQTQVPDAGDYFTADSATAGHISYEVSANTTVTFRVVPNNNGDVLTRSLPVTWIDAGKPAVTVALVSASEGYTADGTGGWSSAPVTYAVTLTNASALSPEMPVYYEYHRVVVPNDNVWVPTGETVTFASAMQNGDYIFRAYTAAGVYSDETGAVVVSIDAVAALVEIHDGALSTDWTPSAVPVAAHVYAGSTEGLSITVNGAAVSDTLWAVLTLTSASTGAHKDRYDEGYRVYIEFTFTADRNGLYVVQADTRAHISSHDDLTVWWIDPTRPDFTLHIQGVINGWTAAPVAFSFEENHTLQPGNRTTYFVLADDGVTPAVWQEITVWAAPLTYEVFPDGVASYRFKAVTLSGVTYFGGQVSGILDEGALFTVKIDTVGIKPDEPGKPGFAVDWTPRSTEDNKIATNDPVTITVNVTFGPGDGTFSFEKSGAPYVLPGGLVPAPVPDSDGNNHYLFSFAVTENGDYAVIATPNNGTGTQTKYALVTEIDVADPSFTVVVDASLVNGPVVNTPVEFLIVPVPESDTVTTKGVTYYVKVDDDAWTVCGERFVAVLDGEHEYTFKGVTPGGRTFNITSPSSYIVRIDRSKPVVSITEKPLAGKQINSELWTLTVTANFFGLEGTVWSCTEDGTALAPVSNGRFVITENAVYYFIAENNTGSKSDVASYEMELFDREPPAYDGVVDAHTYRTNISLTAWGFVTYTAYNGSEAVELSFTDIDGSVVEKGYFLETGSYRLDIKKNGSYTVNLYDDAGNVLTVHFTVAKPNYALIISMTLLGLMLALLIAWLIVRNVSNVRALRRLIAESTDSDDPNKYILFNKAK